MIMLTVHNMRLKLTPSLSGIPLLYIGVKNQHQQDNFIFFNIMNQIKIFKESNLRRQNINVEQ
jgi:hypothetical protein